jgi:hypothetical protein
MIQWIKENLANIFYCIGSLCFLIGTLINMVKGAMND